MTVKELIEALQEYPEDMIVCTEDDHGTDVGCMLMTAFRYILLYEDLPLSNKLPKPIFEGEREVLLIL